MDTPAPTERLTQDLNTCPPGSLVNIGDVPRYQGVTVTRVSDSGVTVDGAGFKDEVLSGRSPATVLHLGEWPEAPVPEVPAPSVPAAPILVDDLTNALKPSA